ncbi:GrpB family protein [Acidicapsa dinghuensis]|uniref:GrpB family protein n=1 Tax=Acidicapsa dinghuensis TaxID=2218256 RepID=A0ABW1EHH5_9BACT|nr:GrpB family protein [Acidicapsa dinghuensis]
MQFPEQTRLALGRVSLSLPNASWPACFSSERERLRPMLGEIADQLEHYGSTAIPGLSAKPIIDMMAPVISLEKADDLGSLIQPAGYRKIDAGFFKRRFFRKEADNGELAYHLHLVVAPTWPLKSELLLRDWLIQHPEVTRAYEALKQDLALHSMTTCRATSQEKPHFCELSSTKRASAEAFRSKPIGTSRRLAYIALLVH